MSHTQHELLGLSDNDVLDMYRYMLLARKLDERVWLLNRAGKVPFAVSCQGQEGAQVGAAFALDREVDYLCPYYRDLAMVLIFGQTARDTMLAAFAKAEDPNSGGRQMPSHFGSRKHRIFSGSSPVTTQLPHATGFALAAKMEGKPIVTLTSLGEGSTNQGDFHEACNFAGVHRLPVIFFCENNRYAISVPISKQLAVQSVAERAQAYGFPGVSVDGNDPLAVYKAVKEAAERARRGDGPSLIEANVYRLAPHSTDDDDKSYRSAAEVAEARKNDSLQRFSSYLREVGLLTDEREAALVDAIQKEVDEAMRDAEAAPYAAADSLLKYVYEEREAVD